MADVPGWDEVVRRFRDFDQRYFGGRLVEGTAIAQMEIPANVDPRDCEVASTKNDGAVIYINMGSDFSEHEWECTLLHEMVHAFEDRWPDEIEASPEGSNMASPIRDKLWGTHSAKFYTLLAKVMRERGHEPRDHFDRYFG